MNEIIDYPIPTEIDVESGLPIGPRLSSPGPAQKPQRVVLEGRFCRLEPFNREAHLEQLLQASTPADKAVRFRYMADRAPAAEQEFSQWFDQAADSEDPLFFAVIDKRSGRVEGRQTLMRISAQHQCIEIGNIYWGPAISKTAVTTEANYLFASYVFEELGYRRYEWKCDALNAPSKRAAIRFGFKYEGQFRRAVIIRGRTRDTAWYSIIDEEWPALKLAYQKWLHADNFDAAGQQQNKLGDCIESALTAG